MPRTTRSPKPAYRPHVKITRTRGVYKIESERTPGHFYTVDAVLDECDCPAAGWGKVCKHRRLGLQVWAGYRAMRLAARGMTKLARTIPAAA